VEYNAGKPLFFAGAAMARVTWQARRSIPPALALASPICSSTSTGTWSSPQQSSGGRICPPPKPRFLVQYRAASVDEARTWVLLCEGGEDIYQYEHQVRNNEQ
jgi:hypothetical protein